MSARGRLVQHVGGGAVCVTAAHCLAPEEWDRLQRLIDCWARPGSWVAEPAAGALNGRLWQRSTPAAQRAAPAGLAYAWRPADDPAQCSLGGEALRTFYKGDFCRALRKRRILVVGEAVANDFVAALGDAAAPGGRAVLRPPPTRSASPAGRAQSPAPTPSPEEDYGEGPAADATRSSGASGGEQEDAAAGEPEEDDAAAEAAAKLARQKALAKAVLAAEKDSIGTTGGSGGSGENGDAMVEADEPEGGARRALAAAGDSCGGGGGSPSCAAHALGVNATAARRARALSSVTTWAEVPICDGALATAAEFRRNDRLTWDTDKVKRARSKGFLEFPWTKHRIADAGVIVLARPVNPEPDDEYFSRLRRTLSRLREANPQALVVVRNVVPPHVNCAGASAPLAARQDPALLGEHAVIDGQNEALRVFLRTEFPGVVHLDVATATALRPDMHVPGDCRAYVAPGPLDHWVRLLANVIELLHASQAALAANK